MNAKPSIRPYRIEIASLILLLVLCVSPVMAMVFDCPEIAQAALQTDIEYTVLYGIGYRAVPLLVLLCLTNNLGK
jgi:hypothetical protein